MPRLEEQPKPIIQQEPAEPQIVEVEIDLKLINNKLNYLIDFLQKKLK